MTQLPFKIGAADEPILIALARFFFLTAAQTSRLFYPSSRDRNREAQRRLKDLADAGYVLALDALPVRRGQAPLVYTLDAKGRSYVHGLGYEVERRFRPNEVRRATKNSPYMQHTLDAIDVLLSATCLTRDYQVECRRMLSERQLKHRPVHVEVPASPKQPLERTRTRAVIPDGWFELAVNGGPGITISVELDRGTEGQRAWREKVAALAEWAIGPYQQAFETDNLTIAVVCPDVRRRDELAAWTLSELTDRGHSIAEIFLFTAVQPTTVRPVEFFFQTHWRTPASETVISLLDAPAEGGVVPLRT
ncbi:hypothetical protein GCM10023321_26200 [Pseudonocardia eucalypti]|uniref:Replication-relaxation n=1 Tax=Pseudonocardia eucalypti TaxID=648755 RepID=A0ABP9Q2W3_9PSEU|nr:hypothetical protein [Pseudonocardia eucalypti]